MAELVIRRGLEEPDTSAAFIPHKPQRPEKALGGRKFKLVSDYEPAGDQPTAIRELVDSAQDGEATQVLLGVTGSGKTFTMAKVIEELQRPALVLAPNKILAAQLYGEFKSFFPENAVEYFVSYYDYYQPEAYVARSDTYIEKESSVNEAIDRMRHSATRALLERDDVIIVASVSCLYGIGSLETYSAMTFDLKKGQSVDQREIIRKLVALQYKRNDTAFARGNFRVRGDSLEIYPSHYEDMAWRISFFGDDIEEISEFDPLTGQKGASLDAIAVFANSHHVTPGPTMKQAMEAIRFELAERLKELQAEGRLLEAQRLEQRTMFDLEMIAATGSCAGIENYSRFLTGRLPGEPPPTLFEYLPENALLFVDESHQTIPQIGAMARGDHRRKLTLAEYGFRLPSCIDNRPLRFNEWDAMRPQTFAVSATPGGWEMEQTGGVFAEQIIRPTGLIDPPVEIRPVEDQVQDCINECRLTAQKGYRTLVTTLTKRMAEDLTEFMHEAGLRVRYMHSDVETLERIELIRDLRLGVYDVLVGINLLREGLDIPECGLVCILDADKEGFLRSETSLIQTIGRAARNVDSNVILYADRITGSMERAMAETDRRREKQHEFNVEHGITPTTIKRGIADIVAHTASRDGVLIDTGDEERNNLVGHNLRAYIEDLEKRMRAAAADLEFEEAGRLRDEIRRLENEELGLPDDQKKAPMVGRSNEGKPGTRKMRYGKTQRKWGR
ncbi:excinuclease ABC subunit UvrB [Altererythrobacter sp. Root672]|uniref:excinuclease ABC subunit UvrB n=1 Tax=Altererythrobacter sp. Root672 TaxID=1736584 RepID=UPI0006FAE07E|nr:excinuclease ABC subunit UvrB [Altererythrobacter sp. Root672]KRA82765.1 excinuclease ABC subunit B [Altererythrobacter sp. Root672]